MHNRHHGDAQSAFTRFSHVHNRHHGDAQSAFTRFSHVHNRHHGDAQSALNTCTTCIRAAPADQSYTARRADHLAFTHGHEKTNVPHARQSRNGRGPPSGGPLPHTVGPSGPTSHEKHTSDGAPAYSPFSRPTTCADFKSAPRRSAREVVCAQNGSSSPLTSGPQLFSLSKIDLRGIWLCAHHLPDMSSQNVAAANGTRRRAEASSRTV